MAGGGTGEGAGGGAHAAGRGQKAGALVEGARAAGGDDGGAGGSVTCTMGALSADSRTTRPTMAYQSVWWMDTHTRNTLSGQTKHAKRASREAVAGRQRGAKDRTRRTALKTTSAWTLLAAPTNRDGAQHIQHQIEPEGSLLKANSIPRRL